MRHVVHKQILLNKPQPTQHYLPRAQPKPTTPHQDRRVGWRGGFGIDTQRRARIH